MEALEASLAIVEPKQCPTDPAVSHPGDESILVTWDGSS